MWYDPNSAKKSHTQISDQKEMHLGSGIMSDLIFFLHILMNFSILLQ